MALRTLDYYSFTSLCRVAFADGLQCFSGTVLVKLILFYILLLEFYIWTFDGSKANTGKSLFLSFCWLSRESVISACVLGMALKVLCRLQFRILWNLVEEQLFDNLVMLGLLIYFESGSHYVVLPRLKFTTCESSDSQRSASALWVLGSKVFL